MGESGDEIQLLQAYIESGEAAVAAHEEKLQGVLTEMTKWSAQKEMLGETIHISREVEFVEVEFFLMNYFCL